MSDHLPVMPTPRSLDLELTSRCNARCRYCYYFGNEGVTYEDRPTTEWLALFEEAREASVMRVCLSGGEALVRDDFFELVDGVVCNNMRFQLLSNGRLLTSEVARRLKATGRCESVQISVDGSTAEIHESMRGPGSFAPAIEAVQTLLDVGLPATVRVTIHRENVEDLPRITALLLDELGLPSLSTNAVSSLGSACKYDGLALSASQRLRAMHILADLAARYAGRIEGSAGPLAEWRMYGEMREAAASGRPISGRGFLVACGCVFERMAVRADGAFVPCVMLPLEIMGYMGRDSLISAWRSPVMQWVRDRRHLPLVSFGECAGCRYTSLCTGNCPGTSSSLTGSLDRPSPEGCLRRFEEALAEEGEDW